MNNDKREPMKQKLKIRFEANLEERTNRALEINSKWFVPKHHFSGCFVECINAYVDGYFVVAAMATQAVNEALIRFIEERNNSSCNNALIHKLRVPLFQKLLIILSRLFADNEGKRDRVKVLKELHERSIISDNTMEASKRILKSFRNDFHHMNPSISKRPIKDIAKRNIEDLCTIEKEIFECEHTEKGLRPKQRKYWDISKDGKIEIVSK